ncbi:hypothetical protein RND71_006552 [Anisodus tanguticus]|uniref:Uncharacterized protein n=1 Tax=Anisodus tanguticus TaxID=243964 RepID=A0AAE1SU71_9SOLA|nr:hypothetical protein RND71_006552 [Anisodus tanguticus]
MKRSRTKGDNKDHTSLQIDTSQNDDVSDDVQGPKLRGRGTFSYQKGSLYSDEQSAGPSTDDIEDETRLVRCNDETGKVHWERERMTDRIVTVVASRQCARVAGLNSWLEDIEEISPKLWAALEASKAIHCPFTVRVLSEEDELLSSIPPRDLEPPRRRPQTSARTAQRLIAQCMTIKLPNMDFGSREYRRQEEARKNRIVSRQNLKSDAWGDDGN